MACCTRVESCCSSPASAPQAWLLSCYVATVAAAVVSIPDAAQAIGLRPAATPWPLLAMLAAAAATAGLAWSGTRRAADASLQPPSMQQQPSVPPRLQQLLARIGSVRQPGASVPTSPLAAGGSSQAGDAAAVAPWLLAWHLLLRGLFYCGLAALPAAVFAVGMAQYDLLHGLYLAGLLARLLGRTLRLAPTLADAIRSSGRHGLLRAYASTHLAAAFVAHVGGSLLQPVELQQPLSIVGLWQPSVAGGMLPLLGLLLLASLQASVSGALDGSGDGAGAGEQHCSSVHGVLTWHSPGGVSLSRLSVTYGPAAIASLVGWLRAAAAAAAAACNCALTLHLTFLLPLQGYCLVLFDCDVSLVGLLYLLLAALILTSQPPRGLWQEAAAARATPPGDSGGERRLALGGSLLAGVMAGSVRSVGRSQVRLARSPAPRWLPLLLAAALAAVDFAAQALLPAAAAAAAAGWIPLPDGALDFARAVVGWSPQAHGLDLALRLLRPLAMLAAAAAYRSGYSLGTLHKQLQGEALPAAARDALRLHAQLGWRALCKRASVLHGSKLVGLLVLAAAMQHPGALGLASALGLVLLAPALGVPAPGATSQQPLLMASLLGSAALAVGWLLAQYALCLPWLQVRCAACLLCWIDAAVLASGCHALSLTRAPVSPPPSCLQDLLIRLLPNALELAAWLGLPLPPNPAGAAQLEPLLRVKCLLLLAAALRLRAFRWQAKLPAEVRAAGRCGAPCPLFWPQDPEYSPPPLEAPLSPSARGHRRASALSLAGSLREAAAVVLSRAQHATQQALRAVDWPAGEAEPEPEQQATAAAAAAEDEAEAVTAFDGASAAAPSRSQQWRQLRFALQDWLERVWQEWHLDMTLFTLLLAAFSAANALSLAYIAAIGAGMALPQHAQHALFKRAVVPLLGAAALFQYSVLLGPPPALRSALGMGQDVKEWLGLGHVDASALWLLFLAYGASVLLVHFQSWARCAQQQEPGGERDSRAPLLSSPGGTAAGPGAVQTGHEIWRPLSLEAQPRWRWQDWLRYWFYRSVPEKRLPCMIGISMAAPALTALWLTALNTAPSSLQALPGRPAGGGGGAVHAGKRHCARRLPRPRPRLLPLPHRPARAPQQARNVPRACWGGEAQEAGGQLRGTPRSC